MCIEQAISQNVNDFLKIEIQIRKPNLFRFRRYKQLIAERNNKQTDYLTLFECEANRENQSNERLE